MPQPVLRFPDDRCLGLLTCYADADRSVEIGSVCARGRVIVPEGGCLTLEADEDFADDDVRYVAGLPPALVRGPHLTGTGISDRGLRALSELKGIDALDLGSTRVSDAGLVHLRDMVALKSLSLSRTWVTGAGLAHVAGSKS